MKKGSIFVDAMVSMVIAFIIVLIGCSVFNHYANLFVQVKDKYTAELTARSLYFAVKEHVDIPKRFNGFFVSYSTCATAINIKLNEYSFVFEVSGE